MKVGSKSEVSLESQVRKKFQFALKTLVFCLRYLAMGMHPDVCAVLARQAMVNAHTLKQSNE